MCKRVPCVCLGNDEFCAVRNDQNCLYSCWGCCWIESQVQAKMEHNVPLYQHTHSTSTHTEVPGNEPELRAPSHRAPLWCTRGSLCSPRQREDLCWQRLVLLVTKTACALSSNFRVYRRGSGRAACTIFCCLFFLLRPRRPYFCFAGACCC